VGHEHTYRAQTDEAERRVLATLLFTDLVGSTRIAATLGDRRWAHLLRAHHARVRELLAAYEGREVDDAGDGFFATFPVASAGVRCATDVAASLRELGLSVRAGLHTGECVQDRGRLRGIAVHVAARVVCRAGRSEVLVTRTVRDVVAGSELEFEDRGSHELRGLPGRWALYAVREGIGRQAEAVAAPALVSHAPRRARRSVPVLSRTV
jgi:class 3 adenylate cyclase